MMKRLLIGMLALMLPITPLLAATSANITLTGTVPLVLTLIVTETGAASGLDLATSQTALKLATVVASTNRPAGLTLSLKSQNVTDGNCTTPCFYSPSTTDFLAYSLKRDSVGLTFTGDSTTYVATTARGVSTTDLNLVFTGVTTQAEATDYSDTLLYTLSAS